MKTIEKSINSAITNHLSRFFDIPEEVLFFDIETTGFSPKGAHIYLIGCAYDTLDGWRCRQYFAEEPSQEGEIVKVFTSFASTFKRFVHFNGTAFDVPFIQAKCKKHALPDFSPLTQSDIYKCISPYKNMLHLPGCRQRQLEEYIGIDRQDIFNGGQLIELYHAYTEEQDERLLKVLLLHNHDDLAGMLQLYAIMAVPMLFELGRFRIEEIRLQDQVCADGSCAEEVLIRLRTDVPLPVPVSCHGASGTLKSCFLSGNRQDILLKLPVYRGELKYFYPDYRNYSYLPSEDQAIHKSVAVYVDKSQRMPATAATCYTRKSGPFLPWFGPLRENTFYFRFTFKDKQYWFPADDVFFSYEQLQYDYIRNILSAFIKKSPKH